jgi:hypothetical protein
VQQRIGLLLAVADAEVVRALVEQGSISRAATKWSMSTTRVCAPAAAASSSSVSSTHSPSETSKPLTMSS